MGLSGKPLLLDVGGKNAPFVHVIMSLVLKGLLGIEPRSSSKLEDGE